MRSELAVDVACVTAMGGAGSRRSTARMVAARWIAAAGLAAALAGCSASSSDACGQQVPSCTEGPAECCGDVVEKAVCVNMAWTCREGYVLSCSAFFTPSPSGPGTCVSTGTGSGGNGSGAAGGSGEGSSGGAGGGGTGGGAPCTGGYLECVMGPSSCCGDIGAKPICSNGAFTCPGGSVPVSSCTAYALQTQGACFGGTGTGTGGSATGGSSGATGGVTGTGGNTVSPAGP